MAGPVAQSVNSLAAAADDSSAQLVDFWVLPSNSFWMVFAAAAFSAGVEARTCPPRPGGGPPSAPSSRILVLCR
ncbi:hypothetical protein AB0L80_09995 [Streptomyces sp. NPDC052069]|uniref:hypothetical protein n=1 Tax=Streptomyces sp. NPDC052069 TaxID=3154650 RepID=UPI0034287621